MEYLDKVVSETLRKYPILGFLTRQCTKEYQMPDSDVVIEKGTKVFLSLMGLHYDPRYFPDPETFDPERFSPENRANMHPYVYLPFGEGPRNCVAKKMGTATVLVGIAMFLRKYSVSICEETPRKLKMDTYAYTIKNLKSHIIKLRVSYRL